MTAGGGFREHLLGGLTGDGDALLHLLRAQVDDSMLEEIAAADCAQDTEKHLAALRPIHETGRVALPLEWEPKEVLCLVRWSEPDDPDWKPGGYGPRGHMMRAFACCVLLRAAGEPGQDGYFDGENQTLAQLLSSVLTFGRAEHEAMVRFIAWRLASLDPGEERPFFLFALLVLAMELGGERFSDERLGQLAERVEREEAAARQFLAES